MLTSSEILQRGEHKAACKCATDRKNLYKGWPGILLGKEGGGVAGGERRLRCTVAIDKCKAVTMLAEHIQKGWKSTVSAHLPCHYGHDWCSQA